MASKFPDEITENEDETISKKRARRVSFAETTAVHFFNRDEECETTPNDVKDDLNSNNGKLSRSESDEIMELLRDSSSSSSSRDDGSNGGDDIDVDAVLKSSFLRPMESPSSGSCFGSATSNNEDDFFGVVSADFIRPGRLSSDSALFDGSHEVTMDSTAFSMNFRSLAKSDSGGGFKTPTGLHKPLGERSNCPASTASSDGNFMVLTGTRETSPHSSLPVDKVNDSGNSDDMSLLVENRRIYDYGELAPELDVLLAGSNKAVGGMPHYGDNKCSNTVNDINAEMSQSLGGREIFNPTEIRDSGSSHTTYLPKTTGEVIFVNVMNVDKGKVDVADVTLGVTTHTNLNVVERVHDDPGPVTPSSNHNQASSFQDIPYEKDKEDRKNLEVSKMFESPPSITQSQLRLELPIAGSISSIISKRRKISKDSDELPQGDKEFHLKRTSNRGWSTSIFAKSVSRLKRIETSFHSDSKVGGNVLRLRSSDYSLRSLEIDNSHVDAPIACLDVRFAESDVSVRTVPENPKKEVNSIMLPKETRGLTDSAKASIPELQDGATLHKLIGNDTEDVQLLQKSSNIYGSNSPCHKRKFLHETENHNEHTMSFLSKLKLCKDQQNYKEELKASHCIESDLALRDWNDVFTSFCGVTNELLAPMSDKLDVALIAKLDDILVHLDKSKSFELLHHGIALDSARFLDSKRVVNTKLLIYKAVCQKAKLQLMRLKKDKLADKASKLKSKVTESERLVSNCYLLNKQGEEDHIVYSQVECHSTDIDNRSLVSAEISSLRKELEDSSGEIRKLNEFFYSRIKNKKELTSIETDASVKGLLKKMLACESRQSKMQLSKVEKLQAMNGQPNILFDHGGFILQSFIMNPTASSGLLLTNKLNNETISKMFISDIEAYTAFSFVLSGDMQVKYESLKTVAEQTQKTVSLLHTLLDVVGEVQLATIDHRSLTRSRFCKPSARKLDLQLCFTDFKSGARVNLSIDITCLNRAIYPSQVLPYEVTGITARNHDVFESLLSDIRTAVQGVRCGFWRILNICRCVARMVQDFKLVE